MAVGLLGFGVQLATLWALITLAGWPWLPATVVAVEFAVLHNFVWHYHVTWRDRGVAPAGRFVRFNLANGLMSIAGNTVLMAIFVGVVGMPPLAANALAVVTMTVVNFVVADRWVFEAVPATPMRHQQHGHKTDHRTASVLCAAVLLCAVPLAAAANPASGALDAWNRYVATIEARLEHARLHPRSAAAEIRAEGGSIQVESGTISDWRGSVFVPGLTVSDVLRRLQHPGTPPPQEDVLRSHVMSRGPDALHVFVRLSRHAIVTATYDTEHEMTFRRWTPTLATARSVATRIEEVGGGDRGFLWRLNSYWRYEQIGDGVQIDLESLTLSRSVPSLVRPIAAPLVSRIARESTVRTLEALRTYLATPEDVRHAANPSPH
jgi:putative flippase GtrA